MTTRRLAAIVTAVATAALVGAGPAVASPSPGAPAGQNCVIVVDKPATPDGVSPERYRYCADTREKAQAHLLAQGIRNDLGDTITNSDLLMTFFEHADYGGYHADIYGGQGTCDRAGYRINVDYWWQYNLSSIAGFAQCNEADVSNRALNYADDFYLPVGYIGDTLNDNVGLVRIYHL